MTPVAPVQLAYVVEADVTVAVPSVQEPKISPEIVLTASLPTFIVVELARPENVTLVAVTAIVLSVALLMVSPFCKVKTPAAVKDDVADEPNVQLFKHESIVVDAAGVVSRPAVEMVVLAVAPKVAMPTTPSVPLTVAPGVTSKPAAEIVVLAVAPKVETPSAPSVPPVKMLVLIVVEAPAVPTTKKTPATTAMVILSNTLSLINENELFIIT